MSIRRLRTLEKKGVVVSPTARLVVLIVMTSLLSCDRNRGASLEATSPAPTPSDTGASHLAEQMLPGPPAMAYSLIELIGNPERYQNGRVSVAGFLLTEKSEWGPTHGFLYLHREDYEVELGNKVKIQFEHCAEPQGAKETVTFERAKELSLQYVFVKGFFTPPPAPKAKRARSPLDLGTICATSVMAIEQRRGADPKLGVRQK